MFLFLNVFQGFFWSSLWLLSSWVWRGRSKNKICDIPNGLETIHGPIFCIQQCDEDTRSLQGTNTAFSYILDFYVTSLMCHIKYSKLFSNCNMATASSLVNVQSKRNCTNFYETQKLKSGWRQSKLPVKLISRQVLLLSEFWFESLVRGNTYRQETDSSRTLDLFRVNACLFALVKSWFLSFLSLFSLAFSIRGALSVTRGTVFHSYSICSTVAWQWHKVTMMAPVHSIKMGPNACLLQSSLFGVAGTHTVQQGHSSSLDNTNPNCKSTQTRWFEW